MAFTIPSIAVAVLLPTLGGYVLGRVHWVSVCLFACLDSE